MSKVILLAFPLYIGALIIWRTFIPRRALYGARIVDLEIMPEVVVKKTRVRKQVKKQPVRQKKSVSTQR